MPSELPTFRGYTIDFRLKEFRRITPEGLEFVSFSSPEGEKLIDEYLKEAEEGS